MENSQGTQLSEVFRCVVIGLLWWPKIPPTFGCCSWWKITNERESSNRTPQKRKETKEHEHWSTPTKSIKVGVMLTRVAAPITMQQSQTRREGH